MSFEACLLLLSWDFEGSKWHIIHRISQKSTHKCLKCHPTANSDGLHSFSLKSPDKWKTKFPTACESIGNCDPIAVPISQRIP